MQSITAQEARLTKEETLRRQATVVRAILQSMSELLKVSDWFSPLANTALAAAKEEVIEMGSRSMAMSSVLELLTPDLKDKLQALWHDPGVQSTWNEHRGTGRIQAAECLQYFMDESERVLRANAKINDRDWLSASVRTVGIVFEKFEFQRGVQIEVRDVGGRRPERKKWMHAFDGVSIVMHVAALNEYDEVLYEDNTKNRVEESMDVFEHVANSEYFAQLPTVLFLNKCDLFKQNLVRVPIKHEDEDKPEANRWTDFEGPNCLGVTDQSSRAFITAYESGCDYFSEKFRSLKRDQEHGK